MSKDKMLGAWFGGYRAAEIDMKHLSIVRVIYNNPATIVFWSDGAKTVVKCFAPDKYDGRTGVLLCCAKRLLGHDKDWYDQLQNKKYLVQVNKNKEPQTNKKESVGIKIFVVYIYDDYGRPVFIGNYSSLEKAESYVKSLRVMAGYIHARNTKTNKFKDFEKGYIYTDKELADYDIEERLICYPKHYGSGNCYDFTGGTSEIVTSIIETPLDDNSNLLDEA